MFAPSDLQAMPTERLEAEIATLYSRISAETCRWLALVAELDRREAYLQWGCRSCADWLSWHCGVGLRAAREQVRVARRLECLPAVRAAFAKGELSYSKVRALTRVLEEDDEQLLELARQTTASQLERVVRAYRRATVDDDAPEAHERRHARWSWDEDGSLVLSARLPADEGVALLKALELAQEELGRERGSRALEAERGSAEPAVAPARATKADALVRVAERALASGIARRSGGDATQVVLHVDADTLAGSGHSGHQGTRGRSEVANGPGLPPEVMRRLGCDASVVAVVERDGKALSVGRKTRTIPPAIRRALTARDRGCRFPGCAAQRFVDAHHIEHWAHGGETKLANLVSLCRHHHRLLHEGGFAVRTGGAGRLVFTRPDGRRLPASPPLPGVSGPPRRPLLPRRGAPTPALRAPFAPLAPCSATEHNQRMDLDLAVWCLVQPARGRGEVSPARGP